MIFDLLLKYNFIFLLIISVIYSKSSKENIINSNTLLIHMIGNYSIDSIIINTINKDIDKYLNFFYDNNFKITSKIPLLFMTYLLNSVIINNNKIVMKVKENGQLYNFLTNLKISIDLNIYYLLIFSTKNNQRKYLKAYPILIYDFELLLWKKINNNIYKDFSDIFNKNFKILSHNFLGEYKNYNRLITINCSFTQEEIKYLLKSNHSQENKKILELILCLKITNDLNEKNNYILAAHDIYKEKKINHNITKTYDTLYKKHLQNYNITLFNEYNKEISLDKEILIKYITIDLLKLIYDLY